MNNRPPQRGQAQWLPYVGLATLCASVIYQAGVQSQRIERNSDRITVLEASDRTRAEKMDLMNTRGARIEAKLDLLAPSRDREAVR